MKMGLWAHSLWLLKPAFTTINKVMRRTAKRPKNILERKPRPSLGMCYLCFWSDVGYRCADRYQHVKEWKPAGHVMQLSGLVEDQRGVCGPRLGCGHCISPIGVTWFPAAGTCSCGNLGNHM